MATRIALAGNPNCGKTTMFNNLTGATQYVGNWPGVTVEKKEGRFKHNKEVIITDLPGIYSLSPYTMEEVVSRNYLIDERPDAILNLVDASNIERNLYLTTQLLELGIPTVVALNMMDVVQKNGDVIDLKKLSALLGCEVVETTALKGRGTKDAAEAALAASKHSTEPVRITFSEDVENALSAIIQLIGSAVPESEARWFAIKLFERDEKISELVSLSVDAKEQIEQIIKACEEAMDDDSESIITNERYLFIDSVMKQCVKKQKRAMTRSDKIDRIVTNRWLALPIFAVVMIIVYYISVTTIGTMATDWANDGVFGDGFHLVGIGDSEYAAAVEEYEAAVSAAEETGVEVTLEEPDPADYGIWVPGIPVLAEQGLEAANAPDWLSSLVLDGVIGGVGAVLGFVPQIIVLFLLLSLLEDCGYMARVAFIMDRIFRKFGLSGKSFIPMLIASGCGVPGVMASKTIENEKDRRMTAMTTTFIPCSAKLPVIALIGGAIFPQIWWMAPAMYFVGVVAVIVSGVILKKTKMFSGDPAPFVMELPQYHLPAAKGVLIHMWERVKAFIIKAGTVIFLASALIWFLSSFGFTENGFGMVEQNVSLLAAIGSFLAPIFAPLGFGGWEAAVATITGLIAKENVVSTFGVLLGVGADVTESDPGLLAQVTALFPYAAAALSFLIFNMLCAPCFAAIGAIRREMGSAKWTWFAIGYQTVLAYASALMINQIGGLIFGGVSFNFWTIIAFAVVILMLFLLFRPNPQKKAQRAAVKAAA